VHRVRRGRNSNQISTKMFVGAASDLLPQE
jgi:hypothetical protein